MDCETLEIHFGNLVINLPEQETFLENCVDLDCEPLERISCVELDFGRLEDSSVEMDCVWEKHFPWSGF